MSKKIQIIRKSSGINSSLLLTPSNPNLSKNSNSRKLSLNSQTNTIFSILHHQEYFSQLIMHSSKIAEHKVKIKTVNNKIAV